MLLKFFFLLVIALMIYRSVRNLIQVSLGREEHRNRFEQRQSGSQRSADRTEPRAPEHRTRAVQNEDIEDARWRDL
jgi:hypothetical protein